MFTLKDKSEINVRSKGNQILAVQKCQAEDNIDRDAGEIRIFHYKSMKAGLKMERSVLINLG